MESETPTGITPQDFLEYNIKIEVDPSINSVVIKQEPPEDDDVITGFTSDWLSGTCQSAEPACHESHASTSGATEVSMVKCETPISAGDSQSNDSHQPDMSKSLESFCVFEMVSENVEWVCVPHCALQV
jgi:hypothetical protein